ncbi:hypothetical protein AYL99_07503 [Fonsecaea erecta]|uniref:Secreted protein n=1 Tax=Fonsecaea erecta TaxID=1367422 RepID=A0A178ZGU9_9EURO|nr:hypothetical protein AYL99_07503 [Fonsecaea erecta]OAP58413.1 hypothetical protein AYL99_07503 [Fonsecaea erecta]
MQSHPAFLLVLVACLARALTVFAAPTPNETPSGVSSCSGYTDTFDEDGYVLVPQLNPVGTYHGVTYTGFVGASKGLVTGNVGGVVPVSSPNVAVGSITDVLVYFGQLTLQPFGTITAAPSGSFDLVDAWMGCFQQQVSANLPGLALGCTVTVTATDQDGNQIPETTLSYDPPDPLNAAMVLVTFPSTFRNLHSVTFGIATSTLLTATTNLALDNVTHCNYP